MPHLDLFNHQSSHPVDLPHLRSVGLRALPHVLSAPGPAPSALADLAGIEVSFLTDEAIAAVHSEFLQDPSPTDVITFAHGEILISTETAARHAAEYHQPLAQELALYLIHGLLHLHGHEDETALGFATMQRLQSEILTQAWPC